jgi:hypothetical protein
MPPPRSRRTTATPSGPTPAATANSASEPRTHDASGTIRAPPIRNRSTERCRVSPMNSPSPAEPSKSPAPSETQ